MKQAADGRSMRRALWRRASARFERGASAVEFALVATVLIPLLFGIADFGLLVQKRQVLSSATRAGARRGAVSCVIPLFSGGPTDCNAGNTAHDDREILKAVKSSLGDSVDEVERVVIYRVLNQEGDGTPITDGHPVWACKNAAAPGGVAGICNSYDAASVKISDSNVAADKARFSCTDLEQYWCPLTRSRGVTQVESVGVYIKLNHSHVTRLFGDARSLSDYSVFKLEASLVAPDVAIPVPYIPPPPTTTTTIPPTTEAPTTAAPTTAPGSSTTPAGPTTEAPTTAAPTTEAPTTAAPTTEAPTTAAPTTEAPTTAAPTTEAPTTAAPTTAAPTTAAPTTAAPTTTASTSTTTTLPSEL